jgi:hypothetical protein
MGQQGNLPIGERGPGPVPQIPQYRVAQVGQLNSDLVTPTGFQGNLQQTFFMVPGKD